MTSFHLGDTPGPVVVALETLDLPSIENITAASARFDGQTLNATLHTQDDTATVTLPAVTYGGLYPLLLRVTYADGSTRTAAVDEIVFESGEGWHTLATAREQWTDAPRLDAQLYTLLSAARLQCEEFAPAGAPSGIPSALPVVLSSSLPLRFRQAQLLQARALWQSGKASPQGDIGEGGYSITVFPMDWTVKALLRPRRGMPVIV